MIKNYFLIALRNIARNKLFSALNIIGLSFGIVACLLIYIYVQDELSFDAHHKKAERIYRIQSFYKFEDVEDKFGISPFPVVPTLLSEYPEIEDGTRLFVLSQQNIKYGEQMFNVEDAYFADSNFFNIFDFHFISGEPVTALANPENVVITKEFALRAFGTEDPMGKILEWNQKSWKVSGVIDEKKFNTHIPVGLFMPMSGMNPQGRAALMNNWGNNNSYCYIVLNESGLAEDFQKKMDDFVAKYVLPQWQQFGFNGKIEMHIEPLKDIRFNDYLIYDTPKKGNKSYVTIFSVVAVLILFIACINYMNMSTAAATRRSKEVALRKVSGASKKQLIRQFIGESLFISFLAATLSILLLELFLPFFNEITGKEIGMGYLLNGSFIGVLLVIILLIGVAAGSYPAFFLARFQPALLLKDSIGPASGKNLFRKVLMSGQFIIAMFMISGTIAVFSQLNFMRTKEIGFRKDQMLAIAMPRVAGDSVMVDKILALKNEFMKESFIEDASFTIDIPGNNTSRFVFQVKTKDGMQDKPIAVMQADANYTKMMGMELVEGRYFDDKIPSDQINTILVNEATVKMLNWKEPLKESIIIPDDSAGQQLNVVGVLKDFHFSSLHSPIEPLVVFLSGPRTVAGTLMLSLKNGAGTDEIANLEKKWKEVLPNKPFEYAFLDDSLAKLYTAEEKMFHVFIYFAALTLILTCMGLYGLSYFSTRQRTKEIGIRKVLGCSVPKILYLLNKEFMIIMFFGVIIAFPLSWYGISTWLENFAYHIEISPWLFVFGFALCFIITVLTVSFQAFRTARANPVLSLRYE